MLESEIHHEDHQREDQRGAQDQQRRILQLVPSRPGDLLGEFRVGLFQIVNELTHLCLLVSVGKLEAGIRRLFNIYQIVTFDICRGSRIRTHIDGFGDR